MKKRRPSPQGYLILTFLVLIAAGALLFMTPFVTASGGLSPADALFMSTSAVCVTGLSVMNTSDFTLFGQIILLTLIQLGALGIMTLSSSLLLFITGDLDFGTRLMASRLAESYSLREIENVLFYIVSYTFICEAVGVVLLWIGFVTDGYGIGEALYPAVFHAVSAFCNAGFSTFDNSLSDSGSMVKTVVMLLITAGGLGFYVIFDLMRKIKEKTRLRIHTKIVLSMSASLSLGGAVLLYFTEYGQMSVIDSLFQSVTARTAGFNTVDLAGMHSVSLMLMIILMFIGASPGSTGGGIKTTTAFLAAVSVRRAVEGETGVRIFGRTIPPSNILKAFTIIFLYSVVVCFASALILLFRESHFLGVLFEVVSAIGTVGLSLGLTAEASTAEKLILTACMFIGRVGPSAMLIAMTGKKKESKLAYPEEKIILG
ncbi:potassium transporter [Geovibrio thiophilus]|uniref:Potassium transporter n=1 Tax=Geovibrio thiophilus TaxID=139438 RepID=A0A410JWL4_9BACT|nr:potassium transporter TrkG [Geovibrio thiophilus]QAR32449.1 potassium transporter [Geovibrio thiophilus]